MVARRLAPPVIRYTFYIVKRSASSLLLLFLLISLGFAEESSFRRVQIPDPKGKQLKAVLTFSDNDKALEVRPAKGDAVSIPYAQIDKCSYEYTKKHRITQGVFVAAMSPATGFIIFLTKSKSHWLEVDYHEQDAPKVLVLRMDKHEYVHILEALKAHTGKDAEILGNANKRQKN